MATNSTPAPARFTASAIDSLRQATATGDGLAELWQSYTALVRDASYRITDADITRLRAADHHTEDEIFELTVAAAVGAALHSFDAGRRAIESDLAQ